MSTLALDTPQPVDLDILMKNEVGSSGESKYIGLPKAFQCQNSVILSVLRCSVMCGFYI